MVYYICCYIFQFRPCCIMQLRRNYIFLTCFNAEDAGALIQFLDIDACIQKTSRLQFYYFKIDGKYYSWSNFSSKNSERKSPKNRLSNFLRYEQILFFCSGLKEMWTYPFLQRIYFSWYFFKSYIYPLAALRYNAMLDLVCTVKPVSHSY